MVGATCPPLGDETRKSFFPAISCSALTISRFWVDFVGRPTRHKLVKFSSILVSAKGDIGGLVGAPYPPKSIFEHWTTLWFVLRSLPDFAGCCVLSTPVQILSVTLSGATVPPWGAKMTKNGFWFLVPTILKFGRIFRTHFVENTFQQKLANFRQIRPVNKGETWGRVGHLHKGGRLP